MSQLRVDDLRALLPDLEELRPLVDGILSASAPDPERRWSVAGELDTLGARMVRLRDVGAGMELALNRAHEELTALYRAAVEALAAAEAGDRARACHALLTAADAEERAWRMARAEAWALAARRVAESANDRHLEALAMRRAARAARGRGRLRESEGRYRVARALALEARDPVGAATAAIGLGNVEVDRGRWERARGHYEGALSLIQGDEHGAVPERWHAHQNLSIVTRRLGLLPESQAHLDAAEAMARALVDPQAATDVENGRGMWWLASGEPERAEAHFRRALEAAADPKAAVTIGVNLAHALLAQKRTLEAAEAGRAAELEAIRSGVSVKLPEVYRLLAEVAAARGHEGAFVLLHRALELVDRYGLPAWERAETLDAFAAELSRQGRDEEAEEARVEAELIRSRLLEGSDAGPDEGDEGGSDPAEERTSQ